MRRSRGFVMVVALATLAGLIAVIAAIAASQRTAALAQVNRMEARRARLAAEAGLQRALAEFQDQDALLIGLGDAWETLGGYGAEQFIVGDASFRIQILDSGGFVDINTAPEDQLQRLPLTTEQIDALLDWRSAERDPRPQGAKDEFYNNLARPYNTKLAAFDSVDELLLVRGFTPATLWDRQEGQVSTVTLVQGEDDEQPVLADLVTVGNRSQIQSPDGQAKLNANQATIGQMVQRGIPANVAAAIFQARGSFQNTAQILQVPGVTQQNAGAIVDNLAPNAQLQAVGRININTASEAVLNTLPEMPPDVGRAIAQRQSTPFNGIGELLTIPGYTLELLRLHADRLAVNSQVFLVRVIGKAGRTELALEGTIAIESGVARLLRVKEAPFANMWERWNWDEEPANDIVLIEEA